MVKKVGKTNKNDARTRILDAADAVFVRRGIDGARMQDIADRARVNKALLHYYFRSKAGLAQAVWLRIASSFVPGIFQIVASDLPLDDKIDRLVDSYHAMLMAHPYLLVFTVSEAARRPALLRDFYSGERRRAARRMFGKLSQQIDEQVKAGNMAPMSAEQFFVTLVGSCVFPFAMRPVLSAVMGLGPAQFRRFMEQRRTELPAFLKKALRP